MPMLKTAAAGTTTIVNVKRYLEKGRVDREDPHAGELTMFEEGGLQLSQAQIGRLEGYLEGKSRALAVDVSEDLTKRNWAREMDYTCARFRHDRPTKTGTPRTYYHFILSPGIDDICDLKTLRAYATAWAQENFRNDQRTHQYAIVYHDDNLKGVLHAHLVVNVSDKATGRKLQISNDEVVRLGNSAQDIGARFGLSPIRPDTEYRHVGVRTRQPIYLTRGERELLNKGQYSWKWELRRVIWDTARRSRDFEDFSFKLRRQGYDVRTRQQTYADKKSGLEEGSSPVLKVEYEYLLYTHKNGKKVRDDRLGAKFYRESLEREFVREVLIDDRRYDSWEVIKISRGEVPWKEDIRRAIDLIAPTVLSIPELQDELERQFGVRFTVNRRGITYVHSSGFKARDLSLGARYTAEGLQQNFILGEMTAPEAEGRGSAKRSGLYRELVNLMERTGSITFDDMARTLGDRHRKVMEEKIELAKLKQELGEMNRLASLQSQHERDRAFLEGGGAGADPALYEGALMRFEHSDRYLRDKLGGEDATARQKELEARYNERLAKYQEHLDDLGKDQAVYDSFLDSRRDDAIPTRIIFDISKTLSRHHIGSYHQLAQTIFRMERKELVAEKRFREADSAARRLQTVLSDIRSVRDAEERLSPSGMLPEGGSSLSLEIHRMRLREAKARLAAAGIEERDCGRQEQLYEQAWQKRFEAKRELDAMSATVHELKEAKSTCEGLQEHYASLLQQMLGEAKKGASSGGGVADRTAIERPRPVVSKEAPKPPEPLPLDEARRRSHAHNGRRAERERAHPTLEERRSDRR